MSSALPRGVPPESQLGQLLTHVSELAASGKFAEAIAPMTQAVSLAPKLARLWTDLGGLFLEESQWDEAREALETAISINPRLGIAHWRLGIALQNLGDRSGAIMPLEEAVKIRPDLADAHIRLASLYTEAGRRMDAARAFRSAARTTPEPARRSVLEAQALRMEGRDSDAEDLLREALKADPETSSAHAFLGQILAEEGRFDEARQHFEAHLERSPDAGVTYYDLVRYTRITQEDSGLLARMDRALQEPMSDINRALLLLARGKALDDLGRYQEAMASLDEASALRSRAFSLDVAVFERQVDDLIQLFNAERVSSLSSDVDDRTPVLILGLPRSGTTLVEQIITSHPDANGAGEIVFWMEHLTRVMKEGSSALTPEKLKSIAAEYLGYLRRVSGTATRVTDKNPFNFLAVGLIHMAFPGAAIIHTRRLQVDNAISIHLTHFSRSTGMPTGGEELVRYFHAYERLMDHWRRVLPAGRMFEVSYEKLATTPHTEIRAMIDHIGLPWNASCLAPHVNSRLVRTPSGWQVRQSINTSSVDRWRNYEPWLGPLVALLENPPGT